MPAFTGRAQVCRSFSGGELPRSAAAFKTPPVHRHDNAQPRLQHAPRLRLFTHDAKLHQSLMRLRRTNLPCLVAPHHFIARSINVIAPALTIRLKYPSQNLPMNRSD